MKKTFTLLSALCLSYGLAQAQDTSSWKEGDDVTDLLEWKNPSGANSSESDTYGGWQYTGSDSHAFDYQEWEMYQNTAGAETYQIFYLPAGVYTFSMQGFYRGSYNPAYWEGNEEIGAQLFAESVTLDEATGDVTEVTRTQSVDLVSIAQSEVTTGRLYTTSSWDNDVEYTYNGTNYYVPNCMAGTRCYFDAGYYENTLKVIQFADGYIKVGVRKTTTLGSDWTIFSNFRAVYEGDASEAVEVELAREEFDKAVSSADALSDQFSAYPALGAYYDEAKGNLTDEYATAETLEELKAGTAAITELVTTYRNYYKDARTLTNLITLSKVTIEATDYAGKADFQAAVTAAEAVEQDGATSADFITTSGADYATAMQTLATARATYEMSKGANTDGSYDFLNIVAYPFFCLPQYNPVFNSETQKWESNSVALNGDGTLLGWSDLGESGTGDDCTYTTTTRVLLADGVSIGTDTTSCYAWYQTGTTAYEPYWTHKLTSAKQWSTPGDRREIVQNLVGLPNGYYSLKGLGITWTNDWTTDSPCSMGIYMQSSNGTVTSTEDTYKSGWWGHDINDWSYYTTGMLQVTDGTLRVAFFANGFSAFTGLQLTYYGENPDFTKMIQTRVAETQTSATEKLILAGDNAYVSDLLATLPAEVVGFEAYSAALDTISKANDYITTASTYLTNNDPTTLFSKLQANYQPEDTLYQVLDVAVLKTFDVYAASDAVYTDIEALMTDEAAYEHYIEAIDGYKAASTTTEAMLTLIDEQLTALMTNYADAEQLAAYENALQRLNVEALLADVDLTKASETNPVDVTVLLTNPSFAEGSKGWTGDITIDSELENAERYNTNFNIYQTLYGLPAGAYRVEVQAFYRDGGYADCYQHTRYDEDGGFQPNVILYANDNTATVVSATNTDANFTDRSFTEYTFIGTNPNAEEGEEEVTLRSWIEETSAVDEETGEVTYTVTAWKEEYDVDGNVNTVDAGNSWMYDYWETEGDERLFFPNSMRGGAARFQKDGGAYINTVETMLAEGDDLTIGLRKDVTIDTDWCLFDNFKLYYLGTTTPTGINSAASVSAKASQYYTIDGRRIAAPQKGVNIVRMSDGTVSKVLVK